ncbi:MAG TPA: HpcH/HpaI aldolase/citrate lyase family protein [Bradyrhizobium sp.]|nr:HpcH/HpaI aldolase/citrate lyase family protein [Bradyrhizobium sp.]
MPAPVNGFKSAIAAGKPQIGLFLSLADGYAAEIVAHAGFDWLLIDGEHAPNDIRSILAQLQAIGSTSHCVVRLPFGEPWLIKQALDIGAQNLMIPMVESADQARRLVRAVRYPPNGIRGVGAPLARASRFSRIADYVGTADREVCLLVQVENRAGIAELDEILAVEGVDGVFLGPGDLAADLGYSSPGAPEVQAIVEETLGRIVRSGKAAGVLTANEALNRRYLEMGVTVVAVGSDVMLLAQATTALAKRYKAEAATPAATTGNIG